MQKKMSVAAAMKYVKELEARKAELLMDEQDLATVDELEGAPSTEPAYDFAKTQRALAELDESILAIRHAINVSNATSTVNGFGLTADSVLVSMATKNRRLEALQLLSRTPKRRLVSDRNQVLYRVRNFDLDAVREEIDKLRREVTDFQLGLDQHNMETEISFHSI